jgi:TolA-binding protein
MFAKYIYTLTKKNCSIRNTWLILVATLLIFSLSACSLSRSPRGKNRSVQRVKVSEHQNKDLAVNQTDDQQAKNDIYSELDKFENKINKNKTKPTSTKAKAKAKRLPTLREQMVSMNQKQDAIDNRVGDIQSDVDEMKVILQELKTTVEYIDSKLANQPIAGPAQKSATLTKASSRQQNHSDDIIMPEKKKIPKKKASPAKVANTKTTKSEPDYVIKNVSNRIASSGNSEQINENIAMLDPHPATTKINDILDTFIKIINEDIDSRRYHQAISKLESKIASEKEKVIVIHYTFLLGESYYGMKDYNKAINSYTKVVKSGANEQQDNAQVRIAECYLRVGKSEDAKDAYKILIVKHPRSEYVPQARKMLQQL